MSKRNGTNSNGNNNKLSKEQTPSADEPQVKSLEQTSSSAEETFQVSDSQDSAARLITLLGFDPTQGAGAATSDTLNKVLEDLRKERAAQAEQALRTHLQTAMDLAQEQAAARKAFAKANADFEKKIGKLLKALDV